MVARSHTSRGMAGTSRPMVAGGLRRIVDGLRGVLRKSRRWPPILGGTHAGGMSRFGVRGFGAAHLGVQNMTSQ